MPEPEAAPRSRKSYTLRGLPAVSPGVQEWARDHYDYVVIPPLAGPTRGAVVRVTHSWSEMRGCTVRRLVPSGRSLLLAVLVILAFGSLPYVVGAPTFFVVLWSSVIVGGLGFVLYHGILELRAGPFVEVAPDTVDLPRLGRSLGRYLRLEPVLFKVSETVVYTNGYARHYFNQPAIAHVTSEARMLIIIPVQMYEGSAKRVLRKLLDSTQPPMMVRIDSSVRCSSPMPSGGD